MVQGALGAAGVRRIGYELEVSRSVRRAGGAGRGILCRHAHSLLTWPRKIAIQCKNNIDCIHFVVVSLQVSLRSFVTYLGTTPMWETFRFFFVL